MPAGAGFSSGLAYGLTGSLRFTAMAPLVYGAGVSAALGEVPLDIMNEAEKLGISTPKLQKFRTSIKDRMNSIITFKADNPRENFERYISTMTLQELRELEAKVKVDPVLDPTLRTLGFRIDEQTLLLEQIEHSKKVLKGKA